MTNAMRSPAGITLTAFLALTSACCTRVEPTEVRIVDTTYSLEEGGYATFKVDGRVEHDLSARDGRIYDKGVDIGPYEPGTPIRLRSDGSIEIGDVLPGF